MALKNYKPSNGFNEGQPKSKTYGDDDFNEGQPQGRTDGDVSGSENSFNKPSDVTHSGSITSAFPAAIFNPNHENVLSLLTQIIARLMKVHVPSDTGRGSRNLFPVHIVFSRNDKDISLKQHSTSAPKQNRRPMKNPVFMKHVQDRDFSNPYDRRQREKESHLNEAAMDFLMKRRRFLSVKYAS